MACNVMTNLGVTFYCHRSFPKVHFWLKLNTVLEFENVIQVPLVLELMGVFLDVLENIVSMLLYISPKYWPLSTANDFIIILYFELFLINLLYYFIHFTVGKNAANNLIDKVVWLKSSQFALFSIYTEKSFLMEHV